MKKVNPAIVLILLCTLTTLLFKVRGAEPIAWAISVFIPSALIMTVKRYGISVAILMSIVLSASTLAFPDKRAFFGVSELLLAGFLIDKIHDRGTIFIVSLTTLLFAGATVEEALLGLPHEIKADIAWMSNLRWGIYYLSAAILSSIITGATHIATGISFQFRKLNFGIVPVVIFIIGAIMSLTKFNMVSTIIGGNISIALFGLLIIQGLAIILHFIDKMKTTTKLLIFFAFVFFPLAGFIIAGLTGMFDYWADFRKLKKEADNAGNID